MSLGGTWPFFGVCAISATVDATIPAKFGRRRVDHDSVDQSRWARADKRNNLQYCQIGLFEVIGADLTPLSLRRLRTTYFVKAVQESMGNVMAADYIAQYAAEVGQTAEILHKFYLIKDPADQVAASKQMADMSNEIIFGRKELLPEDKLQAFKPGTIVSVEVAKGRAEDHIKDLSDLPSLGPVMTDVGDVPKVEEIEKNNKKIKKNKNKVKERHRDCTMS